MDRLKLLKKIEKLQEELRGLEEKKPHTVTINDRMSGKSWEIQI